MISYFFRVVGKILLAKYMKLTYTPTALTSAILSGRVFLGNLHINPALHV